MGQVGPQEQPPLGPSRPPEDRWHPEALPTRGQLLRIAGRDHVARLRGLPRLAVHSIRGMRDSEVLRRHLAVPDEGSFLD